MSKYLIILMLWLFAYNTNVLNCQNVIDKTLLKDTNAIIVVNYDYLASCVRDRIQAVIGSLNREHIPTFLFIENNPILNERLLNDINKFYRAKYVYSDINKKIRDKYKINYSSFILLINSEQKLIGVDFQIVNEFIKFDPFANLRIGYHPVKGYTDIFHINNSKIIDDKIFFSDNYLKKAYSINISDFSSEKLYDFRESNLFNNNYKIDSSKLNITVESLFNDFYKSSLYDFHSLEQTFYIDKKVYYYYSIVDSVFFNGNNVDSARAKYYLASIENNELKNTKEIKLPYNCINNSRNIVSFGYDKFLTVMNINGRKLFTWGDSAQIYKLFGKNIVFDENSETFINDSILVYFSVRNNLFCTFKIKENCLELLGNNERDKYLNGLLNSRDSIVYPFLNSGSFIKNYYIDEFKETDSNTFIVPIVKDYEQNNILLYSYNNNLKLICVREINLRNSKIKKIRYIGQKSNTDYFLAFNQDDGWQIITVEYEQ